MAPRHEWYRFQARYRPGPGCGRYHHGWQLRLRNLAAFVDPDAGNRANFDELMRFATMIAPKLTIQGGTTEVLRGIIARGLGLR